MDNISCVSLTRSNIARAIGVRMSIVPENIAPQNQPLDIIYNRFWLKQKHLTELNISSTFSHQEALQQLFARAGKRTRRSPKFLWPWKRRFIKRSFKLLSTYFKFPWTSKPSIRYRISPSSVIKSIVDIASQFQIIQSPFFLPVIGVVSLHNPKLRPVDHISDEINMNLDDAEKNKSKLWATNCKTL